MRLRVFVWGAALIFGSAFASRADVSWQTVQTGSNPRGIAVGDVDGDGNAEVAVADFGAPSFIGQDLSSDSTGRVQLFARAGSSLSLKAQAQPGSGPRGVAILPYGRIVVSLYGEDLLKTYRYQSGKLVEEQSVPSGKRPVGLAASDGVLAVADYGESKVSIYALGPNDRLDGRFDVATVPGTTAVAVGRLFGRHLPEVAVACLSSDKILILSSETTGVDGYRVIRTIDLPKGSGPADVRLADVDGDGRLDLVAVLFGGQQVAVWLQKTPGAFEEPVLTRLAGPSPNGLTVVKSVAGAGTIVAVAERDADWVELFGWREGRLQAAATLTLEGKPEPMGPVEVALLPGRAAGNDLWVTSHMRSGTIRWMEQSSVALSSAVFPQVAATPTPGVRTTPTPVVEAAPLSDATTRVFPNPLRGSGRVTLRFTLESAAQVDVRVYDLSGRQVWGTTVGAGAAHAGTNDVSWGACNASSAPLASGAYVCRIASGDRVVTKKIFIVR